MRLGHLSQSQNCKKVQVALASVAAILVGWSANQRPGITGACFYRWKSKFGGLELSEFQRRFRDECLNENWFSDLADAREKIAHWKKGYNEKRPHSSLQYRTPVEFTAQAAGFY